MREVSAVKFWILGVAVCCMAVVSATADQIQLTTGETLRGTIVEQSREHVILNHSVLGLLNIASGDVASVSVVQAAQSEGGPEATGKLAKKPDTGVRQVPGHGSGALPGLFDMEMFENWDIRILMGLSGSDGNSQTSNIRIGLEADRADKHHRARFKSTYNYATSEGETTRNQFNAETTMDWLMPDSPWFSFVQGVYDFDEFKAWDHRVSGFAGFGYEMIMSPDVELIVRTGGGVTKEFGGADDLRPEGLVSAGLLRWNVTDRQTVTGEVVFFPDLSDLERFRTIAKVDWQIKLDHQEGMKFKIGLEHEHESFTDGIKKHNDVKFYGTLVVDF